MIETLTLRVCQTTHGFLDIQRTADEVFYTNPAEVCLNLAIELYESPHYQARSLAVFLLGRLASRFPQALLLLKEQISKDAEWRVQEILAKAFDRYCSDAGYENALPTIHEWLSDPYQNVRRAVTEGLRIWTGRAFFGDHPDIAIDLLSSLRADPSEYVRKSVGNALRDISKKHPVLIRAELAVWDTSNKWIAQTHKLACKHLERPSGQEVLP